MAIPLQDRSEVGNEYYVCPYWDLGKAAGRWIQPQNLWRRLRRRKHQVQSPSGTQRILSQINLKH
eukprot:2719069-Pleurochrysis_carterae.AAC.1